MAGLPQHHLIITVAASPHLAAEDEESILRAHGVTLDDIEPAVLALARRQGTDTLRRAARLAATNRAMRQHGFAPLLLLSTAEQAVGAGEPLIMSDTMRMLERGSAAAEEDRRRPLCPDELAGMAAVGLTEEEYRTIKGVKGIIMGLHLDALAHQRLKNICKKGPAAVIVKKILHYTRSRLATQKKRCVGSAAKRKRDPSDDASTAPPGHI